MLKSRYYSWLVPYVEGSLDAAKRALLEQRLASDPALAAELDALRRVTSRLRETAQATRPPASPPNLWPRLQARLEPPRPRVFLTTQRAWAGGLAAVSVLTAVVTLRTGLGRAPDAVPPPAVIQTHPASRPAPASPYRVTKTHPASPHARPMAPAPEAAPTASPPHRAATPQLQATGPDPFALPAPKDSVKPVTSHPPRVILPPAPSLWQSRDRSAPQAVTTEAMPGTANAPANATPPPVPIPKVLAAPSPPVPVTAGGLPPTTSQAAAPAGPGGGLGGGGFGGGLALRAATNKATRSKANTEAAPQFQALRSRSGGPTPASPAPPAPSVAPPLSVAPSPSVTQDVVPEVRIDALRRELDRPGLAPVQRISVAQRLAQAYAGVGDTRLALERWQDALAMTVAPPLYGDDQGAQQVQETLQAVQNAGLLDALEQRFQKRQQQMPANPPLGRMLAAVYDFRGQADRALAERERIVQTGAASGEDWFQLAQAQEQAGKPDAARFAYQQALSQAAPLLPRPDHCAQARQRLQVLQR